MNLKLKIIGLVGAGAMALSMVAPISALAMEGASSFDPACMQAAVTARDTAIGTALDTMYSSVKSALATRTQAVSTAWANTDKEARHTALVNAWSAWKTSSKEARANANTAKQNAWSTFRTARAACHVPANSGDKTSPENDASI